MIRADASTTKDGDGIRARAAQRRADERAAGPVEVCTLAYEFAHGKAPRGRGGWAFYFGKGQNEPEWAPGGWILYGDAKRWAVAEARRRGVPLVIVGS